MASITTLCLEEIRQVAVPVARQTSTMFGVVGLNERTKRILTFEKKYALYAIILPFIRQLLLLTAFVF